MRREVCLCCRPVALLRGGGRFYLCGLLSSRSVCSVSGVLVCAVVVVVSFLVEGVLLVLSSLVVGVLSGYVCSGFLRC